LAIQEVNSDPHRQQRLYWKQMVMLKDATVYISLRRDHLGRWVQGLGTLKAFASCGSIAAWAVWKEYAFVWAFIIAASQLADALKDVFPFAKLHKAASVYAITLSHLFIDAELEWEAIYSGKYTDDEIMNRVHKLKKLQLDAEQRNFPDGLAVKESLRQRAEKEAELYFKSAHDID